MKFISLPLFLLLTLAVTLNVNAQETAYYNQNCANLHEVFDLPMRQKPKRLRALGRSPQFTAIQGVTDKTELMNNLSNLSGENADKAAKLTALVTALGYNGLTDPALGSNMSLITLPYGIVGNIGDRQDEYRYVMVVPGNVDELKAWRLTPNGGGTCNLYFFVKCGNAFYYFNDAAVAAPPPPEMVCPDVTVNVSGSVNVETKCQANAEVKLALMIENEECAEGEEGKWCGTIDAGNKRVDVTLDDVCNKTVEIPISYSKVWEEQCNDVNIPIEIMESKLIEGESDVESNEDLTLRLPKKVYKKWAKWIKKQEKKRNKN